VTSGFFRIESQTKTSSLLSDDVDEQTKKDMDETDVNLDQISNMLGNLHDMNLTINRVVGEQTGQLDRIIERTDEANDRIKKQNKDMDKLMS